MIGIGCSWEILRRQPTPSKLRHARNFGASEVAVALADPLGVVGKQQLKAFGRQAIRQFFVGV
jgi:hypothetical protein